MFRLSLIWFFVLGGLGLFFPFYSLYLRENADLTGSQVGAVMAMLPLMGLLALPFWGALADRTGRRSRVLAGLTLGSALGYAGLAFARGFLGFAAGTALLALFSVSVIPMLVSVTLAFTREQGGYGLGRVRVWGTVGFGLCVGSFPIVLERLQASESPAAAIQSGSPNLGLMFLGAGALLGVGSALAFSLPSGGAEALRARRGDWRELLYNRPFLRLLLFAFASFLFLQGPMALFPLLVREQGGDIGALSRMWLLMLLLEVPLIAMFGMSVARLGLRSVIALGLAAGAVRWLVSGFVDSLQLMTLVQVLHGVVVWGVILGTPMYVDSVVPEALRSTGQTLLAMIGFSLGGVLSNLAAGWLIDHVGATAPAQVGGVGALLLVLLLPFWLPPATRPDER